MTVGEAQTAAGDPADVAEAGRARRVRPGLLAVAAFAAVAAGMTLLATAGGIGLSPDSVAYFISAERISGDPARIVSLGSHPAVGSLAKWPPFFPLVVAVVGWFGADPLVGGRILHAGLSAAVIVLIAAVVRRGGASWTTTSLCLLVVLVTQGVITEVFAQFLSEALFIALTWAAVYCFDRLLTSTARTSMIGLTVLTWVLVACAGITRILGLALVPAFVIAALVARDRERLRLPMVVGPALLATLPALYSLTGPGQAERATTFRFQGTFPKRARTGLFTVDSWFAPKALLGTNPARALASLVVLALAVAGVVWVLRWFPRTYRSRHELAARDRVSLLLLLVGAGYLGMLLWNAMFVDAVTPLAPRHLLPFFLDVVVVAAVQLPDRLRWRDAPTTARVAMVAAGALVVALGIQTASDVRTVNRDGSGYASAAYTAALADTVEPLPERVVVYSDRPDMVLLRTGRTVRGLPQEPVGSPAFRRAARRIGREVADGRAVVVYYTVEPKRDYLPAAGDLADAAGLTAEQRSDAVMLVAGR